MSCYLDRGTEQMHSQYGWRKPAQVRQLDLFPHETARDLARAGVSPDDVARWKAIGWLSPDTAAGQTMHTPEFYEVVFVRSIARSGLSDQQITTLLDELPKPYCYDPLLVAYSFALGWVQRPPDLTYDDIDGLLKEHLEGWLRERAMLDPDDPFLVDVSIAIAEGKAAGRRQRERDAETSEEE